MHQVLQCPPILSPNPLRDIRKPSRFVPWIVYFCWWSPRPDRPCLGLESWQEVTQASTWRLEGSGRTSCFAPFLSISGSYCYSYLIIHPNLWAGCWPIGMFEVGSTGVFSVHHNTLAGFGYPPAFSCRALHPAIYEPNLYHSLPNYGFPLQNGRFTCL